MIYNKSQKTLPGVIPIFTNRQVTQRSLNWKKKP